MERPEGAERIFLTGGAGFIGSHVVDTMLSRGHHVTVYDNLSSGLMRWIQPHVGDPRFVFIEGDLLDRPLLERSMGGHDLVWHLGANTDIPSGVTNTDLDLRNCLIATHNVLEAMRSTGIRDLLFASTGAVYGEIGVDRMSESSGPLLPISLYAAGKLACEAFISAYAHLFPIRAWMFRFGNVIGERMGHGVIHDFVRKLERDSSELEVLGNGEQAKNYFLVEDCIDGMLYCYRNVSLDDAAPCDVFNLGTDSTTGVLTIARIVCDEMGLDGASIRCTGGVRGWPGDQPQVRLSVDKVRRLGWQTERSSDEAVRIAVRRFLAADKSASRPAAR